MAADSNKTSEALRKLAEACRQKAQTDKEQRLKTAGHILRAAKGLTILREKVRS